MVGKRGLLAAVVSGLLISCGSEPAARQSASTPASSGALSTSTGNQTASSPASIAEALEGSIEYIGVSLDGSTITVRPVPSSDACAAYQTVDDVEATETDDSVTVRVRTIMTVDTEDCIEPATFFDTVVLPLQQPLGDRAVLDAAAPGVPLVPMIPPGKLEVAVRLEIDDAVTAGPGAPEGSVDVVYVGQSPSPQPLGQSVVEGLSSLAHLDSDALTLVISPEGGSIWLGIDRQSRPDGEPFEPRTRDQIASVELPLAAAPGVEVTGQQVLLRLEAGAFVTAEPPSIDPTKVSLSWIAPTGG